MRVELLAGRFAVCRFDPSTPWPSPPPGESTAGFFSVTRTEAELSLVCAEDLAGRLADSAGGPGALSGARVESGFRLLRVAGPLPFDAVGVLASLARPLADARVSLFSLSTYDTDYLLVREENLETALAALRAAGHEIV